MQASWPCFFVWLWVCVFPSAASLGRLRATVVTSTKGSARSSADAAVSSNSIQKVITMLENLVSEMDAEAEQDEKQFEEFSKWCTKQQAATSAGIDELNSRIQWLTSALTELYSEKGKLEKQIAQLSGEITATTNSINTATEKRNEEHDSFVKEQSDFDNSIAACNKAVSILKEHYGEPSGPAEKPSWMGLLQKTASVLRQEVKHHGDRVRPKLMSFIQQLEPRYQDARGESMGIVDQMKMLADTFEDDKQSAIDEEDRLLKLYQNLMTEKTAQLNTLKAQRDDRQSMLNGVNQDIAEKESEKSSSEAELKDEQAYLAATKKSCTDTEALFNMRKKDRQEEKTACQEAIKVLKPQLALLQTSSALALLHGGRAGGGSQDKHQGKGKHRGKHRGMHRGRHRHRSHMQVGCANCHKASVLLANAARAYRSDMLFAAAAAVKGSDALGDVIDSLGELLRRIDEEQAMENKHKEWCENEMSTTQQKKSTHEAHVAELTEKIADETETISEKKTALEEIAASIVRADKNFDEMTAIRQSEKEAFDLEHQNFRDAIAALNQAIDVLSKFYAKDESLVQEDEEGAPREMAPGVFDGVYEKKGGSGVVQMISTVRQEFEAGKLHLEQGEAQAIKDYQANKDAYESARRDLVTNQDKTTVEKQTAEGNFQQFTEDKANHQEEVGAAKIYLGQLAGSCDSLLEHFDTRVKLRKDEKGAINEAIGVLKSV